ncbi:hypothetical protein AYI70_g12078 [Smittium culicis]|uniref:BAR domain-containing protein n=1 Tax=Smittium culicis TaxID=133412 RepID=A0A1R1WYX1_9FUNG|nr:hypothetical protein AYI70_g12078 [Smittium culicis]
MVGSNFASLKQKLKIVKDLFDNLGRVGKQMAGMDLIFDINRAKSQFSDITNNFSGKLLSLTNYGSGKSGKVTVKENIDGIYTSVYKRLGSASIEESEKVGLDSSLGCSLFKFGSIEDNVGEYKKKLESKYIELLVEKTEDFSNKTFKDALNSNNQVFALNSKLDSLKQSFEGLSNEEKRAAAEVEIRSAEKEMESRIQESIKKMTEILQSPDLIALLSDTSSAMLDFYTNAGNLLEDLKPELS